MSINEFNKDYNESNKYLIDGIETYIEDSKSANTKKAYKDDWKHFKKYCDWSKVKSLPADYPTVGKYLVYLADGATDVPAFEVVRRGGGLTIAVYDVDVGNIARNMIVGRTHLFAAADYREGSYLDLVLTAAVKNAERV